MRVFKHDPADRANCSFCGIAEDIHLLDGVLKDEQDTGKISCIRCYPDEGWCCGSPAMVQMSIAPSLKPFYDQYVASEQWDTSHERRTRKSAA